MTDVPAPNLGLGLGVNKMLDEARSKTMQAGLGRDVLGREVRTAVGRTSKRVKYGQNRRTARGGIDQKRMAR